MSIFSYFRGKKKPPSAPLRPTAGRPGPDEKYEELTAGEAAGFLEGDPLFVRSSCIGLVQYHPATGDFMVEFHDGTGTITGRYLYLGVSIAMMQDFLGAGSKGAWISLRLVHAKWPFRKL